MMEQINKIMQIGEPPDVFWRQLTEYPGVLMKLGVKIGKNTRFEPGVILHKNVKIGDNVIVGSHTVFMEGVHIGDGCIIGPFNVLERGVRLGEHITMQPHSVLAIDTLVEDNVFIGPHFSCANDTRIFQGPHGTAPDKPDFHPKRIVIRRGAVLGTRVTIAPNVIIGKVARIDMCTFIKKDVPAAIHVKSGETYG